MGGREDRLDGVVVAGGDGVELMVVATGALQGLGEEGFADAVGDIIEEALPCDLGHLHGGEFPRTHTEESGGDDELGIVRVDLIAGDLLADEFVVRFVVVEGAYHVIAIAPGITAFVVVGEATAVGVAGDIEPVLGHAFAVVGTGEEAID